MLKLSFDKPDKKSTTLSEHYGSSGDICIKSERKIALMAWSIKSNATPPEDVMKSAIFMTCGTFALLCFTIYLARDNLVADQGYLVTIGTLMAAPCWIFISEIKNTRIYTYRIYNHRAKLIYYNHRLKPGQVAIKGLAHLSIFLLLLAGLMSNFFLFLSVRRSSAITRQITWIDWGQIPHDRDATRHKTLEA